MALDRISSASTRWRLPVAIGSALIVGAGYLAPTVAMPSLQNITVAALLGLCAAIGVLMWRSAVRMGTLIVLGSFISASLLAMSLPLTKDRYPEVSITATGDKNPKSRSSEVWVRLLPSYGDGVGDFEGAGWEKRDQGFVSYQKKPSVLHYRGPGSSGAALRLTRHPYSGIAEVSIGGKTQRIDLFSEWQTYVHVPLPEPDVSWKSYLQRIVTAIGLGLLFTAAGTALAGASMAWGSVFVLTLLAGGVALWLVKDYSYAGPLEVVAFAANSQPTRIEMNAGHGFTPALVVPVKSGTSMEMDFTVQNPADWRLRIEGGSLRVLRDLDAGVPYDTSSSSDNGCPIAAKARCLYEVQGAGPLRVWLQARSEQKALTLPANTGSEPLFLLVEREPGRIAVSASRAYLKLSPWEHFSSWITAVRVVGQDDKPAGKLVRLLSDGADGYRLAKPGSAEGAYEVPALVRPDTRSFVARKIFAGLMGASFVLLLAAAGKVAQALARSFYEGRRLQVLASVLGCLGWLGLGAVAGWPAIIGWDGFSPYIQAQTGSVILWYGLGYPMIVGGFLLLGAGPLMTAWSVLSTVILLLGAAALLLRRGSATASWLAPALLCVALPFTAIMVGMMTHLRDAMNGLMLAMFALSGFYAALKWKMWSGMQRNWILAGLGVSGTVLILLRFDNIPTLLVLATGLTLCVRGVSVRALALVAVAVLCGIVVGARVEKYAMADRKGASMEMRLYGSTAVLNPLAGMLVYGKGRIPESLYVDIHDTLDKIMDVDVAVRHWSPYHIIYWHETNTKRDVPSVETSSHLRGLFLRAFMADPWLFIRLRLATFGAMLGHEWFEPDNYPKVNGSGRTHFYDHLISPNPNSRHLSELLGYSATAHAPPKSTQTLLDWSGRIATTLPQLLICIIVALTFRRWPLTAVVAAGEIVRAGVFFFFAPASIFLYLYDIHLLGFLLPMMALAERAVRARSSNQGNAR